MKKIPSLFKRDYEGTRLVYDAVVEGCKWVLRGEGIATIKFDGTSCMVRDGKLYKRYDRKLNKKTNEYKCAPDKWESCEPEPNQHTGHWPGWLPVGDSPNDRWHREGFENTQELSDGTYELIGPKVQGNPYKIDRHLLVPHGKDIVPEQVALDSFKNIKNYLEAVNIEGLVWHHPDGRMVKIKTNDFFPKKWKI